MIAVVDVSGAIQIILQKEKSSKFKEIIKRASTRLAPDLFISELTNTFWKYYTAKLITFEDCNQYIEDGINLIDTFMDSRDYWKEAFGEGAKNGHSIYDMYYAIIARRNNGILVTNDTDLAKICKKLKIEYAY
jgi:predicted nucleic acid-binding protein